MSHLRYLSTLLRMTQKVALASPAAWAAQVVLMAANNLIFFVFWTLFFARFGELGGWSLADVAVFTGIICWSFGMLLAAASGALELGRSIVDGRLDIYLARPRHPLPALILGQSTPSGVGDMASAFVFWLWLGERSVADLLFLVILSTASAAVLAASIVLIHSIVFWRPGWIALAEESFFLLVMVGFYPQHVFGFWGRVVVFTVLPAGFIALLPAEAMREVDLLKGMAVLAAAAGYGALAIAVFDRGLRRYASGNRMVDDR